MKKARRPQSEEPIWKSEPGEPPIKSSGDLLAMMAQGGDTLSEVEREGKRDQVEDDERAAGGLPPRKAIISIHGKDVEECEIPRQRGRKPKAA